jgi:general secretion pathway protein J
MSSEAKGRAGFSMIEALAAVALTATIVMALSAVASQWLPNWRRGFAVLQQSDLLAVALERMSEDLSAAEYVTPASDARAALFEGDASSVIFVRSAIGPDSYPHLEVVRFADAKEAGGAAMTRTRAAFAPFAAGGGVRSFAFGDQVPLVRAPLRVLFAYAGPDRVWLDSWKGRPGPPDAVRISVRDASAGGALAASTAVRVKVTAPAAPKQEAQAASGAASPATAPDSAAPPKQE